MKEKLTSESRLEISLGTTETEIALVEAESCCLKKSNITKKGNDSVKSIVSGYGRCKACDCKGYISKHNGSHECKTCGHHYDRHHSA